MGGNMRENQSMRSANDKLLAGLLATAFSIMVSTTAMAGDVAQRPLFAPGGLPPNLLFILDDSGSMRWGFMPDELIWEGEDPFEEGIPISCDDNDGDDLTYFGIRVCALDDENRRFLLSHTTNRSYYNPDADYIPPLMPDGETRYPDVDYNDAPLDGYGNSDETVDLHNQYRAIMDSYYYFQFWNGFQWVTRGFTLSPDGTAGRAFYYEYDSGLPGCDGNDQSDDCFTYQEISESDRQNFANWFSYYRDRLMSSQAGIGNAFHEVSSNFRVGYGGLNTDPVVYRGVRPFEDSNRTDFFEWLHGEHERAGTPLRPALMAAGEYFTTDEPYRMDPSDDNSELMSCRQNFTILMTDGYWNAELADDEEVGDVDGDGASNTLADVAKYYWENDLRGDLDNDVPTDSANNANWQHMVTYGVGLGVEGTLDPKKVFGQTAEPRWEPDDPRWTDPHSPPQAHKIDDLLHAALNSKGGFFSADDSETFAKELIGVLGELEGRAMNSPTTVATNTVRLGDEARAYIIEHDSEDWTGNLSAFELDEEDGSLGNEAWNASDRLPAPAQRNVFTVDTNSGEFISFEWDELSDDMRAALNENPQSGTSDDLGQARLNWLLGDQSAEVDDEGLPDEAAGRFFRQRGALLGDIINSDPLYVHDQNLGFQSVSGMDGNTDYPAHVQDMAENPPVIYVAANDGKLHAIDAESGDELFAYVPGAIFNDLNEIPSPDYNRRYFFDGSPTFRDFYDGNNWRRVVMGSLGAGGKAVYALDVTDPTDPELLWEINSDDDGFENLGYVIGRPVMAYTESGDWVAAIPNGYRSDSDVASMFFVDVASGDLEKEWTPNGAGDGANGMSTPVSVDTTGNRIVDRIYAGDLLGNLWRYDMGGNNSNQWGTPSGISDGRLFTAQGPNGEVQPITVQPSVGRSDEGIVHVFFGTGQFFAEGDNIVGSEPDVQSFYGIQDNNEHVTGRGRLQQQEIEMERTQGSEDWDQDWDVRVTTNEPVSANQDGWYLDLISPADSEFSNARRAGERVIFDPGLNDGRITFSTTIPDVDACAGDGDGWLMELEAFSGGQPEGTPFDLVGDGEMGDENFVEHDGRQVPVTGVRYGRISPNPTLIDVGDTQRRLVPPGGEEIPDAPPSGDRGRQSWREVR